MLPPKSGPQWTSSLVDITRQGAHLLGNSLCPPPQSPVTVHCPKAGDVGLRCGLQGEKPERPPRRPAPKAGMFSPGAPCVGWKVPARTGDSCPPAAPAGLHEACPYEVPCCLLSLPRADHPLLSLPRYPHTWWHPHLPLEWPQPFPATPVPHPLVSAACMPSGEPGERGSLLRHRHTSPAQKVNPLMEPHTYIPMRAGRLPHGPQAVTPTRT